MSWIKTAQELSADYKFERPANLFAIQEAERKLGAMLPADLRELLLESDGIKGTFDLGVVWRLDEVRSQNIRFRQDPQLSKIYMPFEHLLFFGDAGNGDQYGFPLHARVASSRDVYRWDHEDDSRRWFAADLANYLRRVASGEDGV